MSEAIEKKTDALPETEQEIDSLIGQLKEKDNKLLRALADFDNYKKRVAMEQEQFVKFANEAIVKEILPALDGLNKAVESAGAAKANNSLVKGLALINRQINDALLKFGVGEIESVGKKYDPNLHEAIMKKESDQPDDTIIEEVQKGYIMHGRVIRPGMVIVSKPHPLSPSQRSREGGP